MSSTQGRRTARSAHLGRTPVELGQHCAAEALDCGCDCSLQRRKGGHLGVLAAAQLVVGGERAVVRVQWVSSGACRQLAGRKRAQ